MDFYHNAIEEFVNKFATNFFNEYNKNTILKSEISKLSLGFENSMIKKAITPFYILDSIVLSGITKMYCTLMYRNKKNNVNDAKYRDLNSNNRIKVKTNMPTNETCVDFTQTNAQFSILSPVIYKKSMKNTILNYFSLLRNKFYSLNSMNKEFISKHLIPNFIKSDCYTEEGREDLTHFLRFIKNGDLMNVRNIENTFECSKNKIYNFTFEATFLRNDEFLHGNFKIKVSQDLDKGLKIEKLEFNMYD